MYAITAQGREADVDSICDILGLCCPLQWPLATCGYFILNQLKLKNILGTSLAVQWLRLRTSPAGGAD